MIAAEPPATVVVVEAAAVDPRRRFVVLAAAIIGYSIYYVCRLSLSVVKGPLVDSGVLTPTQLGWVGSALFYSYGVGKLVNGFLADRADLRRFASFGLLATALVNLVLGFDPGVWIFFGLWLLNGWFQSMGAPAFVISITRWFSAKERGTYYGIWSGSHNLGEALTFVLTAVVVAHFGWRAGFVGSGLLGLGGASLLWWCFGGPTDGVPTRLRKAVAPDAWSDQSAILCSPGVWLLALASALMYIARYAISSWGMFYLEKAKGYAAVEASFVISASSVAGIIGTIASGWLSDRWFAGDRFKPTILMSALNTLSLLAFVLVPPGWRVLDVFAMIAFGISIGALICYLGGLMAVELAPPKAVGAALGIVGIASYFGAGTQDAISGYLIDAFKQGALAETIYNFHPVAWFWVGSSMASTVVSVYTALTVRGRKLKTMEAT